MSKETPTTANAGEPEKSPEPHMPKKKAGKPEIPEFPFPMPFGEMGDINNDVFEAYIRTSQAILENAAALNQEMVRFAGERFRADLEAIQTLPGYTNVQGVVSFQSEFMRRAAEAYQAEFSRLMQQSTEAMSTVFEPLIETIRNAEQSKSQD